MKGKQTLTLLLTISCLIFTSCYSYSAKAKMDAATKISRLEKTIENLENQLETKENQLNSRVNIEQKLNALIMKAYNDEDYISLACYSKTYCTLFPETEQASQYSKYFDSSVESIMDYVSPENLHNYTTALGNWDISNFVDEFGETTSSRYITTRKLIHGTFSDRNQTNANAALEFIISSSTNIAFSLYENDSTIEVYGSKQSPINYEITIKDGYGKNYTMRGSNTSDRITLTKMYSQTFNDILMKGGFIQIILKTTRNGSPVSYRFNIQDPTFYNNAIRMLSN